MAKKKATRTKARLTTQDSRSGTATRARPKNLTMHEHITQMARNSSDMELGCMACNGMQPVLMTSDPYAPFMGDPITAGRRVRKWMLRADNTLTYDCDKAIERITNHSMAAADPHRLIRMLTTFAALQAIVLDERS